MNKIEFESKFKVSQTIYRVRNNRGNAHIESMKVLSIMNTPKSVIYFGDVNYDRKDPSGLFIKRDHYDRNDLEECLVLHLFVEADPHVYGSYEEAKMHLDKNDYSELKEMVNDYNTLSERELQKKYNYYPDDGDSHRMIPSDPSAKSVILSRIKNHAKSIGLDIIEKSNGKVQLHSDKDDYLKELDNFEIKEFSKDLFDFGESARGNWGFMEEF